MSPDVPRRPPLTKEQRQRNANAAGGVQVAEGATHAARQVTTRREATRYAADGNVLTGEQEDDTGVSITSTVASTGTSYAWIRGVGIGDGAQANDEDAIGIGTAAEGNYPASVAVGLNSKSAGDSAVAIGDGAVANEDSGIYGVAVGHSAAAQDESSVAVGDGAVTERDTPAGRDNGSNVAVGRAAYVKGDYSVNIGNNSSTTKGAHGRNAIAIGTDPKAIGFEATAIGHAAQATADGAVALGTCVASGVDSVAIGQSASATADNDIALGSSSHKVKIAGRLNVARRTPTSSADSQGTVGDITSDDSYVYVKTSTGWKRAALSTF